MSAPGPVLTSAGTGIGPSFAPPHGGLVTVHLTLEDESSIHLEEAAIYGMVFLGLATDLVPFAEPILFTRWRRDLVVAVQTLVESDTPVTVRAVTALLHEHCRAPFDWWVLWTPSHGDPSEVAGLAIQHLADRRQAWELAPDGSYARRTPKSDAGQDTAETLGTFEVLMRRAAAS